MRKKPPPSPATDNSLEAYQPGSGQTPFTAAKGNAGELHQRIASDDERNGRAHLTDNFGHRIADNQNSLKAGEHGPTLLEDFVLREKIFHFDHERIPERIIHARGSGAHGVFECTRAIPEITKADIFQEVGRSCRVFVRFSTVAGGAGSVDTPHDVRGFAVKLYTAAGNWDLVGNNIPVFFIQDAMKFPDLVHSVKMEADRGYPQAASAHDAFWDFIGLMPESFHMIMWAMSDRAIPRSFRTIEGFGVHTFRFVNAKGKSKFVKVHWRPVLGLQSTVGDEAVKIAGADPDYQRRDLFEAIEAGDFPQWDLGVQVFDEAFAAKQPYDVLDSTKLIPEEDVPVEIVGRMTLNRNPDNFFAETEQVAFLPSNIIPGIDINNDPLLQGRLFSYLDTQKSRLGTTNFHHIPINAPKRPLHNFQRDGMMQTLVPKGRANYEPNSLAEAGEDAGPRACPPPASPLPQPTTSAMMAAGSCASAPNSSPTISARARLFFRSQTANEQAHIASALVFELSKVTLDHVRARVVGELRNIDEDLAKRVAEGLAINLSARIKPAKTPFDMTPSDALSIQKSARPDIKGRKVAILFAEGSNKAAIDKLKKQIQKAGGTAFLVAPKVGGIPVRDGTLKADGQLAGSPSVLFDAIASVLTESAANKLCREGAAVQWFMDAFGHCKAIAHDAGSEPLLEKAGVEPNDSVVPFADFIKVGTQRHWDREPNVRDLA